MISSNWAKALEPNILEWNHEGLNEHKDSTTEIFEIRNDSAGILRYHDSFGPRRVSKSSEGAATPTLSKQKGYETVLAPYIFKSQMYITKEMVRWNRYDDIEEDAKDLGRATMETINALANGLFITGFNASYTSYGDGKPLFSTSHTRPDGGTAQSNASSAGITLTEENLEIAHIALRQQKSGTGRKLNVAGGGNIVLMVPESLDKEAVIITGSQLRSGTADNDLNWYKGKFAVYVNPFIGSDFTDIDNNAGSDTAWFLLVQKQNGLVFVWDEKPSYTTWEDKSTDALYTKVYFSARALWKNWYGLWGSKGGESSKITCIT